MSAKTEYKKARKALQSRIRSLRKRGYIDLEDIVPDIPKKITEASARRLREINKNIYKKIRYITQEGYVVSGIKGKEIEKKERKRQREDTLNTSFIENLRERIRGLDPQVLKHISTERQKNILLSLLDDVVMFHEMSDTLTEYVKYLKSHETAISANSTTIYYSSEVEELIFAFTHLADLINEEPVPIEILYELSNFADYYDEYE